MFDTSLTWPLLWQGLFWPLVRLVLLVSLGLTIATLIESLHWTHRVAVAARPLIRLGRLSPVTGASFSMAFFSGVSANTMLAEAYDQRQISRTELVLANLFNSLPRFFLHLPTVFFLTVSLIQGAAFIYAGLTFLAALLQTLLVVGLGRLLLATPVAGPGGPATEPATGAAPVGWREALNRTGGRLRQRLPRVLLFTVPVYILFFFLNRYGLFQRLHELMAEKVWFLGWLEPRSLSIVVLHVTTEFTAGLAAAGALLADRSLAVRDVVLALLVGNVLAAPVRAIRHSLPYYFGIFTPGLALELVGLSQLCRLLALLGVGWGYYVFG